MEHKTRIVFEPIPELEYFDITFNRKTLISLDREILKPLTGRPYRELQFFVQKMINEKYGSQYPPNYYNWSAKKVNEPNLYRGKIKTLDSSNLAGVKMETKKDTTQTINQIDELKKLLQSVKSDSVSSEMLINITKQGYELQIQFLNGQIQHKDSIIKSLENNIEKLEYELDKADTMIDEYKSKSGLAPMIEMAQKFIMARVSAPAPVQSLSNSDTSDIPSEILDILGAVDYSKIDSESMKKITETLRQYITLLPLKGL